METTSTRCETARRSIADWLDDRRWEAFSRQRSYEEASRSWCFFCAAISFNNPWTVTGFHLDSHYLHEYPDRYMRQHFFFPNNAEGFRSRIASLVAGQNIDKVSQEDLERVLAFFTISIVSCIGEHVIPDPPARWHKKLLVPTSRIETWISDAARATGAAALAQAYFSGVPYDDLLDAEQQEFCWRVLFTACSIDF